MDGLKGPITNVINELELIYPWSFIIIILNMQSGSKNWFCFEFLFVFYFCVAIKLFSEIVTLSFNSSLTFKYDD